MDKQMHTTYGNGRSSNLFYHAFTNVSEEAKNVMDVLGENMNSPWRRRLSNESTSPIFEGIVTFTPALARRLLTHFNPNNRNISKMRVQRLQAEMKEDRWNADLPDSTISFGNNGHLINGQHRLSACVASGRPFSSRVETNHSPDVLPMLDQLAVRTEQQQAKIVGRPPGEAKNYSAVKRWWMIDNEATHYSFEKGRKMYELVESLPPEVFKIVPTNVSPGIKMVAPVRGTLLWLAVHFPNEVKEFCQQVYDTEFKKNTGPWLFHKFFSSKRFLDEKSRYFGQWALVCRTFKAFHLFLTHDTRANLRLALDSVHAVKTIVDPTYSPRAGGPFDPLKFKQVSNSIPKNG